MRQKSREIPFGVMLLALSLVMVQAAVAVTARHALQWALAVGDLVLAAGLWLLQPWARWLTLARCLLLILALAILFLTGGSVPLAWPTIIVAVFGTIYLLLPAGRRAFSPPSE